jgi:hypothetical protein
MVSSWQKFEELIKGAIKTAIRDYIATKQEPSERAFRKD